MFYAHGAVWLFFILTGLMVWLMDYFNADKSSFYMVVYVSFIISLYGIALSICALIIKLLMIMVGL